MPIPHIVVTLYVAKHDHYISQELAIHRAIELVLGLLLARLAWRVLAYSKRLVRDSRNHGTYANYTSPELILNWTK